MNKLDQLKKYTTVVADTGDINTIKQYEPQDATTNPSLLLKAAQMPEYQHLIDDAILWGCNQAKTKSEQLHFVANKLMINFGVEILKIIPGRVSTEVDAHYSFDTDRTIKEAENIIELYDQQGVGPKKILIKIASTWEGIRAAEILEKRGIHCNMTLLFSLTQAISCADIGATLISPFVGRIYDWYKAHEKREYNAEEDPGVLSVRRIYDYYKSHHYETIIMGASFRNVGQIEALAGCDYLTISPPLMKELQAKKAKLDRKLHPDAIDKKDKIHLDEKTFRWHLNQDAMATDKLSDGIRLFASDLAKLKQLLQGIPIANEF